MTITTSLPSTVRRPGVFHEHDLTSSANSLTPLNNRVLLIGVQLAAATATADEAQQIFDELTADTLFGQGSSVALMIRKALETARKLNLAPEIWAAGIADPGGTAATHTFTVTGGPAAAAGDIVFRIGEVSFRAGVSSGDTDTVVAAAMVAAINEKLAQLGVTATSALGVVTLLSNDTGVNGNDLLLFVDDVGLTGQAVATALSVIPGVGVADPTTALSNSLAQYYETVALDNHVAADITIAQTHLDLAWAQDQKRWAFVFMGVNGTLGTATTLGTTADDHRIVIGSAEGSGTLPGQIAAAMCVTVSARELANYNWDGQSIPLGVPADSDVYTTAELESALAAGVTPFKPNDARNSMEVVRMVTTKTTEASQPFERAKDLATIRGLIFVTRQIDIQLVIQFKGLNKSAQVIKRIKSVTFGVLLLLEDLGVVQNVEANIAQLLVETDEVVLTRANLTVPESIVPSLHQISVKNVLFVE